MIIAVLQDTEQCEGGKEALDVIFEKRNGMVFSPQMWRKQEGTAGDAAGLDVGKTSLSWESE